MSNAVVEKYGRALFDVAVENGEIDGFSEAVAALRKLFGEEPELRSFLHHMAISKEEKKRLLKDLFESRLPKECLNFLYVLVDKKRMGAVEDILKEYEALVREEKNILEAKVITAKPLTKAQRERLMSALEKKTKHHIALVEEVDESLIGGLVLELDGKRLDRSLIHELKALKFRIREATN